MMDEIDRELLKVLHKNARISVKELSNRINLSQPATSERIKKLEKSGYIEGYVTLFNSKLIGKNMICFCLIKFENQDSDNNFFDFIKSNEDILECHCVSGEYEFLVKIASESPQSLGLLLNDLRIKYKAKSFTYTILKTIKGQSNLLL